MRFLFAFSLFIISSSFSILGAQNFTQKLTTKTNGTVTLHQDQRLTNIINGTAGTNATAGDEDNAGAQTGKKVKVKGWRIQVYQGGSTNKDRLRAVKEGNDVTRLFPELKSYVKYDAPYNRCRVGDFTSKEKAKEYVDKFKESGVGKDAIIVRSEIFVYQ